MIGDPARARLFRSIGVWGLAAIVLNGMVGAGVFALPGTVANYAGSWAPLVVLGVGLALLPVVFVFASLAALFDETGGPILYVKEAFGPTAAFQTGWIQCLSTVASAAANANLLADYVLRLMPIARATPVAHTGIVLAAIALALTINLLEARRSSAWIKRISIAKLVPLAALFLLALRNAGSGSSLLPATDWSISQAILLSVYAFIGFEGGLAVAGEARDPRRDFPRALVSVFLLVVGLYALIVWAYVATSYTPGEVDKAALVTLASNLAGPIGAAVIVMTAVLSILGNMTVNALNVSRRLLALAQIPVLPAWFGGIRSDTGLPRNAVLFTIAATTALALSGGFTVLAALSVASRMLVYLACIVALPVIERRRGVRRSGLGVAVVATALVTSVILIVQSEMKAWVALAATVAVGFAVKLIAARSIAVRPGADPRQR